MSAPASQHCTRIVVEFAPDPERMVAALLIVLGRAPAHPALVMPARRDARCTPQGGGRFVARAAAITDELAGREVAP